MKNVRRWANTIAITFGVVMLDTIFSLGYTDEFYGILGLVIIVALIALTYLVNTDRYTKDIKLLPKARKCPHVCWTCSED